MNDRPRRNRQGRRNILSHHQNHHNGRPSYQSNAPDNYTTSNYRHPSTTTTTTTTDPASVANSNSSSDGCAVSICYSYLIAIFSSFLVVLGIYLSLTKFSARFLFISLIGLFIEAIGACIYCISNIYSSKLTRRKQRIDSDEFILNAGGPIVGGLNLDNRTSRPHPSSVTYILDNQTLTSANNNDTLDNSPRPNGSTAIDTSAHTSADTNEASRRINGTSLEQDNNVTIAIETNDDGPSDQNTSIVASNAIRETNLEQLPPDHNYAHSPEATSGDFTSSTVLLMNPGTQDVSSQAVAAASESGPNSIDVDRGESQAIQSFENAGATKPLTGSLSGDSIPINNNPSTSDTVDAAQTSDHPASPPDPSPSCSRLIVVNYSDREQNMDLNHQQQQNQQQPQPSRGLVASDAMDTSIALRKSSQNQTSPKQSNVRRTLVMGLGGEEELIEIDEDDLDNMSIMPPPYELIANSNNHPTPSSSKGPQAE